MSECVSSISTLKANEIVFWGKLAALSHTLRAEESSWNLTTVLMMRCTNYLRSLENTLQPDVNLSPLPGRK